MSKYSVCILDDKLPVNQLSDYIDDTTILNRNNFNHLLSLGEEGWGETQLYQLIGSLYKKNDDYELFGFKNHSFFFNYIEDNIFTPDIVIFDWDVGEPTDSKQNLLKLLKTKYCIVAIYTGADKDNEVENILSDKDFKKYENRLFKIKKEDEDSVKKLENKIKNELNSFSFKINRTLKQNTLQGIDNILINIGKLSFNEYISLFGENKKGEKELSQIDFIDIFLEKLKYELTLIGLDDIELKTPNNNIKDINKIRELWHYRMYHKTGDDIIRKGDVIKKENKLFLVIASDCHLKEFWKKSLGYLTVIPLHKISTDNDKLKKILSYSEFQIDSYKLSSLVNPRGIDFLTVLPGLIKDDDNVFLDYVLNPREINSISIDLHIDYNNETDSEKIKEIKKEAICQPLKTSDGKFNYIVSLSEPFLSGLFQFISENFSGFGLPDFSDDLAKSIRNKLKELK